MFHIVRFFSKNSHYVQQGNTHNKKGSPKTSKSLVKSLFYLSKLFIVGKSYRFICNSAYAFICLFFNVSFRLPIHKSTQIFIGSRKSVARRSHSSNLDNTRLNPFLFIEITFKIDKFRPLQVLSGFCVYVHRGFCIGMT